QRARLVGEITMGGAHPGSPYRLHPHFEVFIPVGRAINPVTGENWEGVGVIPDVQIPEKDALNAAYRMALKSIIDSIGESESGPTSRLKKEAQEALKDTEIS
ncbi:MAG: hypothetical protein MUO76_11450, partial [Anaerolineaceae bacterium]|nr:hypothetical protein [Anaerolineaceae bacterium]